MGTPPNLLVSSLRRQASGTGFGPFAFAPVGAVLAVVGVAFLALGWRLLPREQRRDRDEESSLVGDKLHERSRGARRVAPGRPDGGGPARPRRSATSRSRPSSARTTAASSPHRDTQIAAGDILVLNCEPDALQRLMERAGSFIVGGRGTAGLDAERIGVVEAVVSPGSELIGASPGEMGLDERYRVNLVAIGRRGGQIAARLRRTKLRAGDVLVLQGELDAMGPTLGALGCLTLAERRLRLGRDTGGARCRRFCWPARWRWPLHGILPIAVALLCAVALLMVLRISTMGEVYGSVAWPVVVLFGTLLPVSAALHRSGRRRPDRRQASPLLGRRLRRAAIVAATLVVALVADADRQRRRDGAAARRRSRSTLAAKLGVSADPFLMAVAVGASCDFRTPDRLDDQHPVARFGPHRGPHAVAARPVACRILVAVVGPAAILTFWPIR